MGRRSITQIVRQEFGPAQPGLSPRLQEIFDSQEVRNRSFIFNSIEEITKMRVTTMQEIEECPARWFGSLGKPKYKSPDESPKNYAMIGTLVHLYAENHLSNVFKGEKIYHEETLADIIQLLFVETPTEMKNLTAYCERLSSLKAEGFELVATETELKIPAMIPIPIYGQVDAVLRNRNTGSYLVLDHKTNRKPDSEESWKKKLQVVSYTAAICDKYKIDEIEFMVGKVNLPADLRFSMKNTNREVRKRYNDIYNSIFSSYHPERVSKNCSYCYRRYFCESYIKAQNFQEFLKVF